MKNKKIKLSFLSALFCFALIGCSEDNSVENLNTNSESGVVSNDEMTLTYGASLLKSYSDFNTTLLNLEGFDQIGARSAVQIPTYPYSNLAQQADVIVIPTGQTHVYNNAGVYYLPAGTSVESITFNGGNNITLIIEGTITSNLISNGNAQVFVGPSGVINGSITMNGGNSNLKNWGIINNSNGAIQGDVENNNLFNFISTSDINVNGNASVTNNCKMSFAGKVNCNKEINNNSYMVFSDGININGSGELNLREGSLTKINGGSISLNGVIENISSQSIYARLDIAANVTAGPINGNNRVKGKIDVNFINNTSITLSTLKADSNVVSNQNTYISASNCTEAAGQNTGSECANSLTFTNVVTFNYPNVDGTFLSATDVKFENNYAYVTYHTNDAVDENGNVPNGAVRVFDMTNSSAPILISQAQFNNAEFNGIDIDKQNNKLYAVGNNRDGARLLVTPLVNNSFNTQDLSVFSTYKLASISAKNTFINNNKLWYTSGKTNGGLFTLDLNNNFSQETKIAKNGAKYVANNGNKQAFFAVEDNGAYLRIANVDGSGEVVYNYPNLIQNIKNGKNVIVMDDTYVYVALSDKGVAKFNLNNGVMEKHFVPNDYRVNGSKVFKKNGATNGVAVDGCYVYLANGADGVIVLSKETFNPITSFSISSGSANFITVSENGYMFVATGRDGLNYIKIN